MSVHYLFINTQDTHKVHTRYTQGIHKVVLWGYTINYGSRYWITENHILSGAEPIFGLFRSCKLVRHHVSFVC